MFHKLLDVFISAVIFLLGIALIYVLLNYALSKITYTTLVTTGYPLNQEYQRELFYRDYNTLYITGIQPYQKSEGFRINEATDISKTPYFEVSNPVENEGGEVILQGCPDEYLNQSTPSIGTLDYLGMGKPNDETYYSSNLYRFAELYPMHADPQTSGYWVALFNPVIYPNKMDYTDNEILYNLYLNNLISKSTAFYVNDVSNTDDAVKIIGGLKYIYAPVPIIGYSPVDTVYAPSYYVITTNILDSETAVKTVAMEREEKRGGNEHTMFLIYDDTTGEWKPLVFGAPDFKNTVGSYPTMYNTFYTIDILYKSIQVKYKINPVIPFENINLPRISSSKLLATYEVVGNPIFSINKVGNLELLTDTPIYRIYVYSHSKIDESSIIFITPIKESYLDDAWSEIIEELNKIQYP